MVNQSDQPIENLDRSVVHDPSYEPVSMQPGLWAAVLANAWDQGIPRWGTDIKTRDRLLREYMDRENLFGSAVGIVAARNASLSWDITGKPDQLVEAAHEMLNNVNFGGGWEEMITQTTIDLATQDNGAWLELVRAQADNPLSPGNPKIPAFYEDERGKFHELRWYQVTQLLELPSPRTPAWGGFFYKLGYSNLTLLLRAARIMESLWIFNDEKLSGRFNRAIHLIQGMNDSRIQEALTRAQLQNDSEGLRRFAPPVIATTIQSDVKLEHQVLNLAGTPEGFDEEKAVRLYILALSMAFKTDYQEFAPLPGGNLGTSAQSEILDKKSRGKGPALFQRLVTRVMNMQGVMPRGIQFAFNEGNPDADEQHEKIRKTRAETNQILVQSRILSPQAARQQLLDAGDIPVEVFDALGNYGELLLPGEPRVPTNDLTPDATLEGEQRSDVKAADETVAFGPLIMGRLHRAYSDTSDDVSSLGYFSSTEERIKVASAIGPALAVFEDQLRDAGLWDLQVRESDVDAIVAGKKSLAGIDVDKVTDTSEAPPVDDEDARLDIEADVKAVVKSALNAEGKAVRDRLRQLAASGA